MLSSCFRRFASAFKITPAAAAQVKNLLRGDFENRYMKIDLKKGGCAGFAYDFGFVPKPRPGDHVFEEHGAKVVMNDHALLFLRGSTLDFETTPFSSSFKVELPDNSENHTCTCGRSVGKEEGGTCVH